MKRAVLLLEGLLLFKHLREMLIGAIADGGFKTGAYVVVLVDPGRACVRRGAAHSFHSLRRLVVRADHLLVEELVGDT